MYVKNKSMSNHYYKMPHICCMHRLFFASQVIRFAKTAGNGCTVCILHEPHPFSRYGFQDPAHEMTDAALIPIVFIYTNPVGSNKISMMLFWRLNVLSSWGNCAMDCVSALWPDAINCRAEINLSKYLGSSRIKASPAW